MISDELKEINRILSDDTKSLLREQLNHAVSLAATEGQIVWNIFGIFWAASAVLVVALFDGGNLPKPNVAKIVSGVGVVLSLVWGIVQWRAINYQGYYEDIISLLEAKLKIPNEISLSGKSRNNDLYKQKMGKSIRIRPIMILSGFFLAILWAFSFYWFGFYLVCI